MGKNKKHVIDLFEENELIISELYKVYSQNISGHKIFWAKLSNEEIKHAKDIHDVCGNDDKKKKLLTESKFCRYTIKYVSYFVKKKIEKAKKGDISQVNALNTALRIEQSILEKKCFELFVPTESAVKKVLKKLNKETEGHIKLLRKEIEKTN